MDFLKNFTPLTEAEILNTNSQNLAFVGDAIHSLYVRERLLRDNLFSKSVHSATTAFVNAGKQSYVATMLLDELQEEELAVFKRGRNFKTATHAKNAKIADYRNATGFEALLGYLYLTGKHNRLNDLLNLSYSYGEKYEDRG